MDFQEIPTWTLSPYPLPPPPPLFQKGKGDGERERPGRTETSSWGWMKWTTIWNVSNNGEKVMKQTHGNSKNDHLSRRHDPSKATIPIPPASSKRLLLLHLIPIIIIIPLHRFHSKIMFSLPFSHWVTNLNDQLDRRVQSFYRLGWPGE